MARDWPWGVSALETDVPLGTRGSFSSSSPFEPVIDPLPTNFKEIAKYVVPQWYLY